MTSNSELLLRILDWQERVAEEAASGNDATTALRKELVGVHEGLGVEGQGTD